MSSKPTHQRFFTYSVICLESGISKALDLLHVVLVEGGEREYLHVVTARTANVLSLYESTTSSDVPAFIPHPNEPGLIVDTSTGTISYRIEVTPIIVLATTSEAKEGGVKHVEEALSGFEEAMRTRFYHPAGGESREVSTGNVQNEQENRESMQDTGDFSSQADALARAVSAALKGTSTVH